MLKTVLAVAQALFVAMFGLHAAPALSQDLGPGDPTSTRRGARWANNALTGAAAQGASTLLAAACSISAPASAAKRNPFI